MFDLFADNNIPKVDIRAREYFDPNKHSDGIIKIKIKFLIDDWEELKITSSRIYKNGSIKNVKVFIIEDSRAKLYNQKGKELLWQEMPTIFTRLLCIQINENCLEQKNIDVSNIILHLHIDPSKNAQKYKKSKYTFSLIEVESVDDNFTIEKGAEDDNTQSDTETSEVDGSIQRRQLEEKPKLNSGGTIRTPKSIMALEQKDSEPLPELSEREKFVQEYRVKLHKNEPLELTDDIAKKLMDYISSDRKVFRHKSNMTLWSECKVFLDNKNQENLLEFTE